MAAHGVPYVATASVAYLGDLKQKVKKAMTLHGPRYIQIDTPCPSVWNFPSHLTLEIGRLGVNSGLVPLFEMVDGKITKVKKLRTKVPVIEYLKQQKRFQHLVVKEASKESLTAIQEQADQEHRKIQADGLTGTYAEFEQWRT